MAFVPITINPGRDFIQAFSVGLRAGRALRQNMARQTLAQSTSEAFTLMRDMRAGIVPNTPENEAQLNELVGTAIGAAANADASQSELVEIFRPLDEVVTDRAVSLAKQAAMVPAGSPERESLMAGITTLLSGAPPARTETLEDGRVAIVPENAQSQDDIVVADDEMIQTVMGEVEQMEGRGLLTYQRQARDLNDRAAQVDPMEIAALGDPGGASTVLRERNDAADRRQRQIEFAYQEPRRYGALEVDRQRAATEARRADLTARELDLREAGRYSPRSGSREGGTGRIPKRWLDFVNDPDAVEEALERYPRVAQAIAATGESPSRLLMKMGEALMEDPQSGVSLEVPDTVLAAFERELKEEQSGALPMEN